MKYADIEHISKRIVDGKFIIFTEHQSTWYPNMPLRMLSYIARTFERMFGAGSLYSTVLVKIPTPKFYVFYNGV